MMSAVRTCRILRIREAERAERAEAENIRVSVNVVELKKQSQGRLGPVGFG